jgi:hypothetical protein
VIPVEVTLAGAAQPELDVIMHVTTCPFVNAEEEYVVLLPPTFDPFTCH